MIFLQCTARPAIGAPTHRPDFLHPLEHVDHPLQDVQPLVAHHHHGELLSLGHQGFGAETGGHLVGGQAEVPGKKQEVA